MKRLLILQMCRFGDILQTTPMLRGIRRHFPETDVTLVVNDAFRHVPIPSSLYDSFGFLPYSEIVEMLAKDSDAWPAAVGRLGAFVESLGDDPFDLTLNLTHSDLASFLAAAIPSHEVRGGLVAPDRSRTVRGEVMTYFWASQLSRAQGCFNLVDLHNWTAGVPSERLGLEVEIPGEARARMNTWMSEHGILGRPFIAVQLGASDDRKRWPPERFGEAINQLEPDLGEILLVGTAAERAFGERAKARITRPVHDSLGQSSIVELAVLLESASLLLTNDTGTMHVATAVGTKVVDVSTGPVFAHETGPYGEGHLVIEPQMSCFPCAGGSECHHLACRDAFTPEDIAALVRHALGRGPVPRPTGARILEGGFGESGRLERDVGAAVQTNSLGTYYTARAARDVGSRFVLVSTDKGFGPVSVMGASKRLAERLALSLTDEGFHPAVVRFGNVLGSSGSVVELMWDRICRRQPLVVTHSEASRFFMSADEAASLVMLVDVMRPASGVYWLDMGTPVRILDLARRLLLVAQRQGYTPVPIEFSGLRPGEKLTEEFPTSDVVPYDTRTSLIYRLRDASPASVAPEHVVSELQRCVALADAASALSILTATVLEFEPSPLAVSAARDLPHLEPARRAA